MFYRTLLACVAAAGLLSIISLVDAGPRPKKLASDGSVQPAAKKRSPRTASIADKLMMPVELDFTQLPLPQVVSCLRNMSRINFVIDAKALREDGIDVNEPVTLHLDNVTLKTALNVILRQVDLAYAIEDDVCWITTPARAHGKLKSVTYSVADLVVPVEDYPLPAAHQTSASPTEPTKGSRCLSNTLEEQLITLITTTVAPQSWDSAGGRGNINYFPLGMALVINQTEQAQEEIADLLAALRRLQDVQVAVEVRLVSASAAFVEKLRSQPEFQHKHTETHIPLSTEQTARFLHLVQEDRHASIMQAPKVTLYNGQEAALACTDEFSFVTDFEVVTENAQEFVRPKSETVALGVKWSVRPVVSADRRSVRVALNLNLTNIDPKVAKAPVTTHLTKINDEGEEVQVPVQQYVQQPKVSTRTLDYELSIPDGQTVLLDGGQQMAEGRNETGFPILSNLPYLGRLLRNVGYTRGTQHLLVLVTPRIFINEEEEMVFVGTDSETKSASSRSRSQRRRTR